MPTPKQSAFLWLKNLEAFYGGAGGGGKSDALLMGALQYVDIPGYSAILIRDTYKNLAMTGSLIDRSFEWLSKTDTKWKDQEKRWVFPSGASLSFGYLDSERDHFNYQSAEFQFIGIDEMVNIREDQALYMFSRLRKKESKAYREDLRQLPRYQGLTDAEIEAFYRNYDAIPLRFRGASNPPNRLQIARGQWVKDRYVDKKKRIPGAVFISAKIDDNPHINAEEYRKSLGKLDEITRQQIENGNWDIVADGKVFDPSRFSYFDPKEININDGRIVCVLDPSKGVSKGDYPAIWWGQKKADGVTYLIDALDKNIPLEQALKESARRNYRYRTREYVYESNGAMLLDRAIKSIHEEVAKDLGCSPIKMVIKSFHHSTNKEARILNMEPFLYNGEISFRTDWEKAYPEAMKQVALYGSWDHDDYPDALEFLIWYLRTPPFVFQRYEGIS